MAYRGHVKNGIVTLDDPVTLPEGAEVLVDLVTVLPPRLEEPVVPTLYEQFKEVIGKAQGLPPDMAQNHDYYLHGLPKR